jgi:hypothetical protein
MRLGLLRTWPRGHRRPAALWPGRAHVPSIRQLRSNERTSFLFASLWSILDKAEALDKGERELFAHALALPGNARWVICSPDLAAVKFAAAAGTGERVVSLEEVVNVAAARPGIPLRHHFTSVWLSTERTRAILRIR